MQVSEVTDNGHSDRVKLHAVYTGDKNSEDNTFAEATPTANIDITINNPTARGLMKPGQKFYVDFSPAE